MGILKFAITRVSVVAVAASLAGVLLPTGASAQSSTGNWGAEGRIGGGQTAYLLRWLNNDWSLVLGGGANVTSSENEVANTETRQVNGNFQVLLRDEFRSGRVRPFIGFGPQLNFVHSSNESPTGAPVQETKNRNISLGGRFEFGAIASINQSVGLGFVLGAIASVGRTTSVTVPATNETKMNSFSASFGNPQFVMRVRF